MKKWIVGVMLCIMTVGLMACRQNTNAVAGAKEQSVQATDDIQHGVYEKLRKAVDDKVAANESSDDKAQALMKSEPKGLLNLLLTNAMLRSITTGEVESYEW